MESQALITNDAVVLGILLAMLAFVFTTSHSRSSFWQRFYGAVPSIFVCYFLPSVFATAGDHRRRRFESVLRVVALPAAHEPGAVDDQC